MIGAGELLLVLVVALGLCGIGWLKRLSDGDDD